MKRRENTITMPDETTLCENSYGIKLKRGEVQYCQLNYIKKYNSDIAKNLPPWLCIRSM